MKKVLSLVLAAVLAASLSACGGALVDLDTPKSEELTAQYDFYPDAMNTIRADMKITPEQADEVFIVLTSCGLDGKITSISESKGAYTVYYGGSSLDVALSDGAVEAVYSGRDMLYPEYHKHNVLMDYDLTVKDVKTGSGDKIGEYAYIRITKAQLQAITEENYKEFVETVVKDSGYNWVAILCDDGTGICFPGSMYYVGTYGKQDTDGSILEDYGDIPLEDIGSTLMLEYEAWLKDKGICPNSTSYYMRNLRAVYNRAVDRELTVQRSPFKHVYTGIDKTVKRAVPLKAVRMIRDLDLRLSPGMEYARDMFMLSFYTRGMSFVDIAYLKKADLKSGVLTYRRRKTGRRLSIKWEKPMQEILDRYGHNDSPYLFPVIRDTAKDAVRQYRSAAHFINGKLKELGKRLGLGMPLTMYVARHAWASIARSKNVPLATISEAMGHDSENTTRIYLASLDTSQVDKANDIILKSL